MSEKRYVVIINWNSKVPESVLKVAVDVDKKMTGNEHFENPAIPMPDFSKGKERLQEAVVNRSNGKLAQIELKNATAGMDAMMREQAVSVTELSKGDNAIIETSGFKASKGTKSVAVVPDMPTDVKMTTKNNTVTLITMKPKGAASVCWVVYLGEVTGSVMVENNQIIVPAGVNVVILCPAKAREVLTGIATGTKVTAQVLAQSAAGKSALSEMVTIFANK